MQHKCYHSRVRGWICEGPVSSASPRRAVANLRRRTREIDFSDSSDSSTQPTQSVAAMGRSTGDEARRKEVRRVEPFYLRDLAIASRTPLIASTTTPGVGHQLTRAPSPLRGYGATAFVWLAEPKPGAAERRLVGAIGLEPMTSCV